MNRSLQRKIAIVLILPLAVVAAACGSDDDAADDETAFEPRPEYAEYCAAAEEAVLIDDQVEAAEAHLAAAPDELKPDLELVRDAVMVTNSDTATDEEKATASQELLAPFQRLVITLSEECNIRVNLN